jgi:hypothetical protein
MTNIVANWQPIATAPKDGRMLLLADSGRSVIGHWYNNALYGPGWSLEDGFPLHPQPTHWAPVPILEPKL